MASTDLQTYKIVKGFITSLEREEIIRWVDSIDFEQNITNHHIKEVRKNLNGNSYMFDISKTKNSEFISKFQSSGNIVNQDPPNIIYNLIDRISETIELPKDDIILQVIDMNSGGKVNPHYDSAIDGHINYKCNISVMSDSYNFYVDKEIIEVNEGDLYCFEASLYKHWSDVFLYKRILLSFGFIIPYNVTGRNENDPRVRLSQRIQKYFQQL